MNQKNADKLIKKLGMSVGIQSLLDSGDEGYSNFESIVGKVLSSYGGKESESIGIQRNYPLGEICLMVRNWPQTHLEDFPKAIDYFKRYYGIGQNSETFGEIALGEGVTVPGISRRVDFVTSLLKQKHRKDIWYGSMGE